MNRMQYLMSQLMEESCEVSLAASKCIRFGPSHAKKDCPPNAIRVLEEIADTQAVYILLLREGHLPTLSAAQFEAMVDAKIEKIEKYYQIALQMGSTQ